MQQINISYKNNLYKAVKHIDKAISLSNHEACRRLKIILFYREFGLKATLSAFELSKPTLMRWQQTYKLHAMRVLIPLSKKPHNVRQTKIPRAIEQFILNYRALHPRVCQYTIKPELDAFCKQNRLPIISTSSIERIIRACKINGSMPSNARLRIYARSGKIHLRNKPKIKKLRRKKYMPAVLVQIDSVHLTSDGIKKYLLTAIDIKSRFAYSESYNSLNSKNAQDFMQKLQTAAPFKISRIQTDNGSEFEKSFYNYAKNENIIHYHNYPKSPKSNAFIERFNRTIQEQFVQYNREDMFCTSDFKTKLADYIFWYNNKRAHKGLNYITPMQYILNHPQPQIQICLNSHMC